MLLGSRLCLFELVEHGLGGDVAGDLLQVGVGFGLDPHPVGNPRHQRDKPGDLVLREQAQLQVEVRPQGRRAAALRFWLVRTKVDLLQACEDVPFSKKASETGTAIHVEPFTQSS